MDTHALPYKTIDQLIPKLRYFGLWSLRVQLAHRVSVQAHINQTRDDGSPYLNQHIYPIIDSILHRRALVANTEEAVVVAFLHDVLEDNANYTYQMCQIDFGSDTAWRVDLLTKKKQAQNKKYTQLQKCDLSRNQVNRLSQAEKLVRLVKLEDRLNNIICSPIPNGHPKYERYAAETKELFIPLAKATEKIYVDLLQQQLHRLAAG